MTRPRKSHIKIPAIILTGSLLLLSGVGVGVLIAPEQTPAAFTTNDTAETFPVSYREFTDEQSVKVKPTVTKEVKLRTKANGQITDTDCDAGTPIKSGTSIFTINDTPLLSIHTKTPLWRDLTRGVKGKDVLALQKELKRLGYTISPDGEYGYVTRAAIKDLQKKIGVEKPSGDLNISAVMWLPNQQDMVKSCDAGLGAEVPADGLVTVSGGLSSLRVVEAASATAEDAALDVSGGTGDVENVSLDAEAAQRQLTFQDFTAAIKDNGVVKDREFLKAIQKSDEYIGWQRSNGEDDITLKTELVEPLQTGAVPPGTLYNVSGKTACILADGQPQSVTIVSSSLGNSLVAFAENKTPKNVEIAPADNAPACS
ncbi:peptidoglycan-binding domain-containing protein [Timonella sp. A28]|uniref:peptidoglycan-binding domain-containing protein n=1 Tax=Timonella sp. A28 TaxID=3442640 RepID=UPI003EBFA8A8